uniref:DUF659 domain-containing protein n=1 Tax=Salix viminalis TaxID=40686 RepID=A0A6N2N8T1_SALVM
MWAIGSQNSLESLIVDKVFEMLDAIMDRIEEENMVQVISDNATNYKEAGKLLMGKRKGLFWTPCTTHCIDLILKDFEKKLEAHQVTIVKGRRNHLVHIFKNYSYFHAKTLYKRKRFDQTCCHSICYYILDSWMFE